MVFEISKSVQSLERSKGWNVDGTFGSCPQHFYQLQIFHAEHQSSDASDDARWSFRCVWVLLPGKDDCLMSVLESLGSFQPDTIMVD